MQNFPPLASEKPVGCGDKLSFSPDIYATSSPRRTCALKTLGPQETCDKLSPSAQLSVRNPLTLHALQKVRVEHPVLI